MTCFHRLRVWVKSPRSSVLFHRASLWTLIAQWPVAEKFNWVDSPAYISRLSILAFIYAVIACILTAKVQVDVEEEGE